MLDPPKLSGADRKSLRALAHHREPVIRIGKGGVTAAVIAAVNKALDDHELIKVKFQDFKDEKKSLSESIAGQASCHQVGMIGNVAVFYRRQPDPEKRRIDLGPSKGP